MQTVSRLDMLRTAVADLRRGGARLALVPTMGALHEGHLTLVREAKKRAERVVVSIFVNPTQFGPTEDLDAYPRVLDEDQRLLQAEGVDLLWAPPVGEMYPEGFASSISVRAVAMHFCGEARPGHFDGVATVVCKLFNQVLPDFAFFGEKDWQQLAVIRQMARDLNLGAPQPDAIFGVGIVREADGLAMSSRNRYLTPDQRAAAAILPQAMRHAIARIESGHVSALALAELKQTLEQAGFHQIDYAGLADAISLKPVDAAGQRPVRLLVAARIGTTRLIDNMPLAVPTA
ncbi:MAG: pantoate--beta-alanine ligase [Sphingomonadaceae bacterium]